MHSTEPFQQRDLLVTAHGDDRPKTFLLRKPDDQLAELAGPGGHDEGLLAFLSDDVEHGERCQRIDDHRGGILVAYRVEQRNAGRSLRNRIIGPRTPVRPAGGEGDAFALQAPCIGVIAGGDDEADAFETGRLPLHARLAVLSFDESDVGRVDRGEADLDQRLCRAGFGHGDAARPEIRLHRLQRAGRRCVGVAVAGKQQGLHF